MRKLCLLKALLAAHGSLFHSIRRPPKLYESRLHNISQQHQSHSSNKALTVDGKSIQCFFVPFDAFAAFAEFQNIQAIWFPLSKNNIQQAQRPLSMFMKSPLMFLFLSVMYYCSFNNFVSIKAAGKLPVGVDPGYTRNISFAPVYTCKCE